MDEFAVTTVIGGAGFLIGLVFGLVTRWADFCALGALADMVQLRDKRRLRSWLLAIATAIFGTHALHWRGTIDVYESIYLGPSLGWAGAVLGGAMFGYGTVMARGCGGRAMIRLAGGDLRALVSLLTLGFFAYMTLRGLVGPLRQWIEGAANIDLSAAGIASQGLPELVGYAGGWTSEITRIWTAIFAAGGLAIYCLADGSFRRSTKHLAAGLGIGVLVTAGWWTTGVLGRDEFEPVALTSLTFVRPIGDGLQYLMIFTGATITFGVAVIGGVLVGGFAIARANNSFRLDGFRDTGELSDYLIGGALMGVGGVLALGCTIGQGVTGIATLSLGSMISLAAILAGGWAAITRLGLNTATETLNPIPGE